MVYTLYVNIYKTKPFAKWADKEGLTDAALATAAAEVAEGNVEAKLGSYLYKKRVARQGQGKSGGYRTIIAYRIGDKAFYLFGFDKGAKSNISQKEREALSKLAKQLMGYTPKDLGKAVGSGALIKIEVNDG